MFNNTSCSDVSQYPLIKYWIPSAVQGADTLQNGMKRGHG